MNRQELKAKSRKAIEGKIWILLAINLVAIIAISAISFITYSAGAFLVAGGWTLSLAIIYLAIINKDKKPAIEDILLGFKNGNFGRSLVAYIRVLVFTTLWSLLLVIPGIVKGYAYSQIFFLLADDPKLDPAEAQKKSIAMMNGHKGELFVLHLSFIPWWLLVTITFGLAAIYVGPYFQATLAQFYANLKKA
ncbi:MAG: DUF975 family protein [Candidatus Nomurabacteria bacterium]|jgi:uncharacterized membrane protein|nr:DUF975 family protein [Candidatus Nomurabacteria bacterium]